LFLHDLNDGSERIEEMRRRAEQLQHALGRGMHDSFVDFLIDGEFRFKDFIRRMAAEVAVSGIFDLLSVGLKGGGGVASFFSKVFGGARAAGGPVSAGKSYLVGERGPELFKPSGSGKIVPHDQMASGGVNITIGTINADDAIGVRRAVEEGVSQAISASAANTVGMIRKQYRPSIA
jgi:phage-related minor tail protein